MSVLHPAILVAGILAAAIPILIHLLFRRRRPPIAWAAMELLLEAYRRQQRRLRLEQLLLLACRCLIFGLAGLALARPVLESTGLLGSSRGRTVVVLLDDGVATRHRADGRDATAFERLRRDAATFVRDLAPGDEVSVVLAGGPARSLVAPASSDREAVARALEQLEPRWGRTDLEAAIELARPLALGGDRQEPLVAVFSEFRLGSLDPTRPPPPRFGGANDATILLTAPADGPVATVAVTALEVQRAVGEEGVDAIVRLVRSGGGNAAGSVRLLIEGDGYAAVPPRTVFFEAGQETASVEQQLRPLGDRRSPDAGSIVASVEADAMPADDRRYAWFDPRSALRIGVVTRRAVIGGEIEQVPAALWIMRALAPAEQPGLEVATIEPAALDARSLRDVDAVFLPRPDAIDPAGWSALRDFAEEGGLLVVMPAPADESQAWTDRFLAAFELGWTIDAGAGALAAPVGFAPMQPPSATGELFAAIAAELPGLLRPVEVTRRISVANARAESVLLLDDGSPFLLATPPSATGRGLLVLLTAAPELASTNLPVKPFMVPFTQEIVRRGLAGIGRSVRAEAGRPAEVPSREAVEAQLIPSGSGGATRRIRIAERRLEQPPSEPGLWRLLDEGGRSLGGLAVNVDPLGTRLDPQSGEAIIEWFNAIAPTRSVAGEAMAESLRAERDSTALSVWLLSLVLALAFLETIAARRASHASSDEIRSDPGVAASTPNALAGRAAA